uniref:DNA replication complex GINS protein PSF2-like n=1 Tax=Ciona intestinalis TaxID=7719 RepID=UPI000180D100|nr:DNA replication complex GINS protein PSF2-like [Ciona intestinalis]|eukprot:XP_026691959.1 DNA replication complex GINS protein PSF2-like [Ciona intestinalis]
MEHSEMEFIAEKQKVKIVPNFSMSKIYFISGEVGPFQPGLPTEVPFWLAISLRQRQKCVIHPPDWLTIERLEEIKEAETTTELFTPLPNTHFREMCQLLLTHAKPNIQNADAVRTLVKDIWDIRAAKLRSSSDKFIRVQAGHARIDNLTLMEINIARPFLLASLDHLHTLRTSKLHVERIVPTQ